MPVNELRRSNKIIENLKISNWFMMKIWGCTNLFSLHYWPGGYGYRHTSLRWFDSRKRVLQVIIWKYKGGNKGLTFRLPLFLQSKQQ